MALSSVLLAVTLFGIPLAVLAGRNAVSEERSEIERIALRAAVEAAPDTANADRPSLPQTAESEPVGLYDTSGRRIQGEGPARLESQLAGAFHGRIVSATTASALLVAVPLTRLSSSGQVTAVVRAASPVSEVHAQAHLDWLVVVLIGVGACGVAIALAMAQSRRLARPIQRLERVAIELGNGNLAARSPMSGVAEVDRAGTALNATAARLAGLLAREQAFSAQASHQLRTPLTGLRLQLESALQSGDPATHDAIAGAMQSADELSRTIDDVLHLARHPSADVGVVDVEAELRDVAARWSGLLALQGRDIVVELHDPPELTTSGAALRQVLEVLVDNAYTHGRGRVDLVARDSGGVLAVDVVDDGDAGPLLPPPADRLGLGLAQSTALGQGGRIVQATGEGRTRMTLLLPTTGAELGEPD